MGDRGRYRLIDTAEGYQNEEGVGEAIRSAGVPRGELFITSKLRNGAHQRDSALRAFDQTMEKLGIEQLDLFLIHWPVPGKDKYVEAWKTLVELRRPHQVDRVSSSDHLERIIGETGVTPVVNSSSAASGTFHSHDIRIQLARRQRRLRATRPSYRQHGKSVADDHRWHLQAPIVGPKSSTRIASS